MNCLDFQRLKKFPLVARGLVASSSRSSRSLSRILSRSLSRMGKEEKRREGDGAAVEGGEEGKPVSWTN